jgi:hypothetical protein
VRLVGLPDESGVPVVVSECARGQINAKFVLSRNLCLQSQAE